MKYMLLFQTENSVNDSRFRIYCECCNDDEALRNANVGADVMVIQQHYKFTVVVEQQGRPIAVLYQGYEDDDFSERPIKYSSTYIPSRKDVSTL